MPETWGVPVAWRSCAKKGMDAEVRAADGLPRASHLTFLSLSVLICHHGDNTDLPGLLWEARELRLLRYSK